MVEEPEREYRTRIDKLREAVQEGLDDIAQGRTWAFEAQEAADYLVGRASQLIGNDQK